MQQVPSRAFLAPSRPLSLSTTAAAKVAAGVARLQYHLARWLEAMEEVGEVAMAGRPAVVKLKGVVLAAADMVMAGAAMVVVLAAADMVMPGAAMVVVLAAADMVMAGAAMVGGGVVADEVE